MYNLKPLGNGVHSNSVEDVSRVQQGQAQAQARKGEEMSRRANWLPGTDYVGRSGWAEPLLCAAQSIFVQQRMGSGFRAQGTCFQKGSGGGV